MNKIQFDRLLKPLVKIYDDIELDLIKNILDRLENYNSVQGSLEWYLEKLMDLGKLDKDNLKILKDHKEQIELALTEIATFCGYNIDNLEQFNKYYENGLIKVNPSTLNQSIAITNLISEALKDTDDIMNLINTKALEGVKESYKNILNKAYVETASGVYTYTESIRNALKDFAKEGIQTVHYRGGKTLSIESVVRRDVITRMNKLVGDVEIQHAKELDTNLVYVDQHLGARVRTKYMKHDYEAHAEWQGKKYMLEGSSDEYQNLYETTGYGEMLGLKGINCYHNMRPTWEWEKIPDRIDEVENAKVHEQLQQQRKYERKLRQLKRERLIAKESNNIDDYKQVNDKFKETSQEFNKWLEQNDLTRDYNREYVADIQKYDATPSFIGKKENKTHTQEEILKLTYEMKNIADKYVEIPSKWSGNVIIDNMMPSGKLWSCDIRTRNDTSSHELLHEILHSKSISYYDRKIYIENRVFEEIPVQFMAQEISLKEQIEIIPSNYDNMVDKLRYINENCKIEKDNYLFAKKLLEVPVIERYDWLVKKIGGNKDMFELLKEIKEDVIWNKK